jgi:hypothetical protein
MSVTDRVVVQPALVTAAREPQRHRAARAVAVVGLGVTAWVHVPLVPEHWAEVPYLGVSFAVLVVASAALVGSLLVESSRVAWSFALALTSGAVVLYAASRSVGLPGAADDVGSWGDPAGVVAVAAELVVATTAVLVLMRRRSTR